MRLTGRTKRRALGIFASALAIVLASVLQLQADKAWPPKIEPLVRTIDLNIGESCEVTLADGTKASVKLLDIRETRDNWRNALRKAMVDVEVNGRKGALEAANYRLPVALGGVQIDCAVTKGYVQPTSNAWTLNKDARLRLWPAGSPWIRPGTFVYPTDQRWFATDTQMCNEPVFADGPEDPDHVPIYYHYGLDIGGAEKLVRVLAATDGVVVAAGEETVDPATLPDIIKQKKRYDVVYLRDGRGWYYRYSHLDSFDPALKPGVRVKRGQEIGRLGKQGGSGGWSHLHFDISAPQPSGEYGIMDGYAFLWQAYHAEHKTPLTAVARPHHAALIGENVTLDASRSWSEKGPEHIVSYEWLFCDGTKAEGPAVTRSYATPGHYSELLKVTDADGRTDYDVAVVQIFDPKNPKPLTPSIHAVYWPSLGLKAGDEITFKARTFEVGRDGGREQWDFGDGAPAVQTQSDGNAEMLAPDGYAVIKHRYEKPGDYFVTVTRSDSRGRPATARLHVHIAPADSTKASLK